jgi:putative peptidoglycan lipid II flippase
VEFPLGLFGVAIGTVILPHLSRRFTDTDSVGFSRGLDWGLRVVLLVGLPAALGLLLLAEPLVLTVFQRGAFDLDDARMTALALMAMSIGVPGFMLSKVLAPAFFARQDTRTPMRAAITTVAFNVALTVLLVTPMWLLAIPGAHAGIALATALAGLLNPWLLWRALGRQQLFQPGAGWTRYALQLLGACVLMTATVLLLRQWIGDWAALSEAARWGGTLLLVAAGALAYALGLLAAGLRPRDLRES